MLYGLETVARTKTQEAELDMAELEMMRFSLRLIRMYRIRDEHVRRTAQVGQ